MCAISATKLAGAKKLVDLSTQSAIEPVGITPTEMLFWSILSTVSASEICTPGLFGSVGDGWFWLRSEPKQADDVRRQPSFAASVPSRT